MDERPDDIKPDGEIPVRCMGFCQANLEVGDPLTGTNIAPITMPKGFTYHLQELAFVSWFFGGCPPQEIHTR